MRLYHNRLSPFVRKVTVLLHELDCPGIVDLVDVVGHPVQPGSLPVDENPLGKIPTLAGSHDGTIYDSRVICRYLNDYACGEMYPAPPEGWQVQVLEATADGVMDAAVLMVYESRCRDRQHQSSEWVGAQWDKIRRSLDHIESEWIGHLEGRAYMGHIALGCALGYLDFRHPERDWRTGRSQLADWFREFSDRNSMQTTIPVE